MENSAPSGYVYDDDDNDDDDDVDKTNDHRWECSTFMGNDVEPRLVCIL